MTAQSIAHSYIPTASCVCETCNFWDLERKFSTRTGRGTIEMAQCLRAGIDDNAPNAEVLGRVEPAVMTAPDSHCDAWGLNPNSDLAADWS